MFRYHTAQKVAGKGLFLILIYSSVHMVIENYTRLLDMPAFNMACDIFFLGLHIFIVLSAVLCACFNILNSLVFLSIIIIEMIISVFLNIEDLNFILSQVKAMVVSLISVYIMCSIYNEGTSVYRIFLKASHLITCCCVMTLLAFQLSTTRQWYDMTYANCALLPACVYLNEGYQKKKISLVVASFVLISTVVVYGSRGALIVYFFFFLCRTLLFLYDNYIKNINLSFVKRKNLGIILCVILGMMICFVGIMAVLVLHHRLDGIRTFDLFANGQLFSSSGRVEWFYKPLLDELRNNLFWGHGLYSDRMLIFDNMLKYGVTDATDPGGTYAHNFFLEIVYQFGLLKAIVFIIFILGVVIFALKRSRKCLFLRDIIWLLICMNIMLLYSSSYLKWHYFWILMGLSLQRKKEPIRH